MRRIKMPLEFIEVSPLPEYCIGCKEEDCYNCDYAGYRWVLSPLQELELKKKLREQTNRRQQRDVDEIDRKIKATGGISDDQI
jgi:hypothetical protein